MFICKECHRKRESRKKRRRQQTSHTWEDHMLNMLNKGIATCELCGERTICVDCQIRAGNL